MSGKTGQDILGIDLLVKQAEGVKPERSMPKGKGEPFLRCKVINGRPYWYTVQNIKINGKWKQKVLKYHGSRKPREAKQSAQLDNQ